MFGWERPSENILSNSIEYVSKHVLILLMLLRLRTFMVCARLFPQNTCSCKLGLQGTEVFSSVRTRSQSRKFHRKCAQLVPLPGSLLVCQLVSQLVWSLVSQLCQPSRNFSRQAACPPCFPACVVNCWRPMRYEDALIQHICPNYSIGVYAGCRRKFLCLV